jgi:hypothetical protein
MRASQPPTQNSNLVSPVNAPGKDPVEHIEQPRQLDHQPQRNRVVGILSILHRKLTQVSRLLSQHVQLASSW